MLFFAPVRDNTPSPDDARGIEQSSNALFKNKHINYGYLILVARLTYGAKASCATPSTLCPHNEPAPPAHSKKPDYAHLPRLIYSLFSEYYNSCAQNQQKLNAHMATQGTTAAPAKAKHQQSRAQVPPPKSGSGPKATMAHQRLQTTPPAATDAFNVQPAAVVNMLPSAPITR